MIHKILKDGRCPICGRKSKMINGIYVCDNCKIVFNEFGVSKFAKEIIMEMGTNFEFDIFGHPNEDSIKENLN